MKLPVATTFLIVVLHSVKGAEKCYLCVDAQCKSDPYIQNCDANSVCIAYQYKLQNPVPEIDTSKHCTALDSSVISDRNCQNADEPGFVLPTLGCYYCSGDLCNVAYA